jgi:hypothetical protein
MCGRYRLSRRKQIIEEHFDCGSDEPDWAPRYNIAPTQPVAVIRQNPTEPVRDLSLMRWGLIPSWSKDPSAAARMINARAETAATKPAFSDALKSRRGLIPADGFYEWVRTGKAKQPYCFEVNVKGNCSRSRESGIAGRPERTVGQVLFDPDNDSECCDSARPRPHASDSRSRQLRSLARSGHDKGRSSVRLVETLRCSTDAMLPGEAHGSITWLTMTQSAPRPWNSLRFRIVFSCIGGRT